MSVAAEAPVTGELIKPDTLGMPLTSVGQPETTLDAPPVPA